MAKKQPHASERLALDDLFDGLEEAIGADEANWPSDRLRDIRLALRRCRQMRDNSRIDAAVLWMWEAGRLMSLHAPTQLLKVQGSKGGTVRRDRSRARTQGLAAAAAAEAAKLPAGLSKKQSAKLVAPKIRCSVRTTERLLAPLKTLTK